MYGCRPDDYYTVSLDIKVSGSNYSIKSVFSR